MAALSLPPIEKTLDFGSASLSMSPIPLVLYRLIDRAEPSPPTGCALGSSTQFTTLPRSLSKYSLPRTPPGPG